MLRPLTVITVSLCAAPACTPAGEATGPTSVDTDGTTGPSSIDDSGSSSGAGQTGAMPSDGLTEILAEPWRQGDPEAGRTQLLYGDNTGAGVPIAVYLDLPGPPVDNALQREGISAEIPWFYNTYETPNGVAVAAPSCLGCHGSRLAPLGDTVVVGLGNAFDRGTLPSMAEVGIVSVQVDNIYGADSAEADAFRPLFEGVAALLGHAETPLAGTNAAFFIEEAAIAHRDPDTLQWSAQPNFPKATTVLASDVPPWWHLSKKHSLYYNGMGRGDAARLLTQASVLATFGVAHINQVDAAMPDLLAFLLTLEAPVFPEAVDASLVSEGEVVFEATCAVCHGTYGVPETYPNLLVSLDVVGTDPAYAEYFDQPGRLVDAYNQGWFGAGEVASRLQPELGYVAPPLDGIWATAPYFHNGSVPTLGAVLDSTQRPAVWLRDFESRTYELDDPGLAFEVVPTGTADAYDATLTGYGNGGHTFGDALTTAERTALVEYLKTL